MSDQALIAACHATVKGAQEALAWVADPRNETRIGHERAFFERTRTSQVNMGPPSIMPGAEGPLGAP